MRNLCAIIPAAGKGTRLGIDRPKILAPISDEHTIWSILRGKLLVLADHIQVVLSPAAVAVFEQTLQLDPERQRISIVVQPDPTGMGTAIFQGQDFWKDFDDLLIVWGDQVNLSERTLRDTIALHRLYEDPHCTMPVVKLPTPYVQYDFDDYGKLSGIRQTREGDQVDTHGWSDTGTFCLSVRGLHAPWRDYCENTPTGTTTAEINFLPFLTYLSRAGWSFHRVEIADAGEARGVNTPEDLDFAKRRITEMDHPPPADASA
jgi:bifunctional UDP-N-acetylglucosamine pyrophosphorylase / glucosamine-1-phosphate N-acetyltransferase